MNELIVALSLWCLQTAPHLPAGACLDLVNCITKNMSASDPEEPKVIRARLLECLSK